MRRREFVVGLGAAWPCAARAQLHSPRIGFLSPGTRAGSALLLDALLRGLHNLGYEKNKNLEVEEQYASSVMSELTSLTIKSIDSKVDVIVTSSIPAALAAKHNTSNIPVVVAAAGDFVGNGLAASMERPGGNLTGIDEFVPGLAAKRLQLLHDAVSLRSVAILSSATGPTHARQMEESLQLAQALGLTFKVFRINKANEIESSFEAIATEQPSGLLVFSGVLTAIESKRIAELATKHRLPGMFWYIGFVNEGGLMYYGPNVPLMFEQSAILVDQVLKVANPAEMPVQYAKQFELIINAKTARMLGIVIPQSLVEKADRVIE